MPEAMKPNCLDSEDSYFQKLKVSAAKSEIV
jgi:hypothetical protein